VIFQKDISEIFFLYLFRKTFSGIGVQIRKEEKGTLLSNIAFQLVPQAPLNYRHRCNIRGKITAAELLLPPKKKFVPIFSLPFHSTVNKLSCCNDTKSHPISFLGALFREKKALSLYKILQFYCLIKKFASYPLKLNCSNFC